MEEAYPRTLANSYNAASGKNFTVLKTGPNSYERLEGGVRKVTDRSTPSSFGGMPV